ncbi:MAG: energy transducer TonB [Enhygromyxa sp.]
MSDQLVEEREGGDSSRARPVCLETLPVDWTRDVEQVDWCVDAKASLAAGCSGPDSGVSAMPASERRAIRLTRQRIRAQAILAAAEPEQERRERIRRGAIVIGSALLHAIGFVVLATAVADLQPRQRPSEHEHLFEARAIVPIEPPAPASPEPEAIEPQPQPQPVAAPPPKPSPPPKRAKPAHDHAPPSASESEPAPYELRGFELSSQGERPAGEPGGESWGRSGGSGAGAGAGAGEPKQAPAASKPDVAASPSGGLLGPEYPPELERQGVEGSVLVKVWIDEHGHVIKAEVVESSGHESFDHNALMAAQRQEWTPAIRDGEPVSTTQRYRVRFRLR